MADRNLKADSLAVGISVVLAMTIVQRGIGFVRGIWFCRLMDEPSLGQWAIAFGFLTLVTPIILLGLPGSLPRFIDVYHQKGQLKGLLFRILGLTATVVLIGMILMLAAPQTTGRLVFGDQSAIDLVFAMTFAALAIIAFNIANDVTAGLRLSRLSSTAQFINSIAFTILGTWWLYAGGGVAGLLVTFGLSYLVGMLPIGWVLRRLGNGNTNPEPIDAAGMWRRVLPFAAAIWAMNLLSNSFELADRYMLLHLSHGDAETGQRMLGQYHSSLIFPYLFVSLANMAAGVLTPYMVSDWERGDQETVMTRTKRTLILASIGFTATAALTLVVAPSIFANFLQGRYDGGLNVMPVCFLFCVWFGVATLAQTYLWVAERGRIVAVIMAAGLGTNVLLNALLVPRVGLEGAVWGTCLSHLVVLVGTWMGLNTIGYKVDRTVLWVTLLPMLLLAGPGWAMIGIVAAILVSADLRRYSSELVTAVGCQIGHYAR